MRTNRFVLVVLAAAAAGGCFNYERQSSTGPSGTGVAALMGSWGSTGELPSRDSCSNFSWNVTEQTDNSAAGTFTATCAGGLQINGTARGTLSGDVIRWNAEARATSVPIIGTCDITLTGTAELGVDSIRIPYSGNTCVGQVSGVETLRKR